MQFRGDGEAIMARRRRDVRGGFDAQSEIACTHHEPVVTGPPASTNHLPKRALLLELAEGAEARALTSVG